MVAERDGIFKQIANPHDEPVWFGQDQIVQRVPLAEIELLRSVMKIVDGVDFNGVVFFWAVEQDRFSFAVHISCSY